MEEDKISLKELYIKERKKFEKWIRDKAKTGDKYIRAMDMYLIDIYEPKEAEKLVTGKTKALVFGIRNFLRYLEKEYYMTELNGYNFDHATGEIRIIPKFAIQRRTRHYG